MRLHTHIIFAFASFAFVAALAASGCSDVIVPADPTADATDAGGDLGTDNGSPPVAIPDDSVAHYRFEGDDEDTSGNEYDLVFDFNPSYTADRFGFAEHAMEFRGSGNGIYYATGMAPGLVVWPEGTFAVWVNGGANGNERRIVGQHDWIQLKLDGQTMSFGVDTPELGDWMTEDPEPHPTDRWVFYVGTASRVDDGDGAMLLRLYRDGELVDELETDPIANTPSGCLFFVGPRPNQGQGCTETGAAPQLNATLDDVRVFRRALSAAEIGALYREGGW